MAVEHLVVSAVDGVVRTAANRLSCIAAVDRITLPHNFFYVGRALHIRMGGRISCAVTTPGTLRFDVSLGAAGNTIVFDTLALSLNIVAKTTVPWAFDCLLVCRSTGGGALTTFFPTAWVASEAIVGAGLPTVGGNGWLSVPVGTPAAGGGMDNAVASILDVYSTQTLATGSLTVHDYCVDVIN